MLIDPRKCVACGNRLEGRSVTAIDLTRIEEELEGGIFLHAVHDDVEAVAGEVLERVRTGG